MSTASVVSARALGNFSWVLGSFRIAHNPFALLSIMFIKMLYDNRVYRRFDLVSVGTAVFGRFREYFCRVVISRIDREGTLRRQQTRLREWNPRIQLFGQRDAPELNL
ncbi:MAG: hypothetical protein P8Z79_04150 [Sedimentisphaerales bacterium]|jgi:hypothetical protein